MIDLISGKRELFSNKNTIKQFSDIIGDINSEFEDHLIAINENTNEIQSNYELLSALNSKIDKISEKLEKIELFLQEKADFEVENEELFDVQPLSDREKEIFLVLYCLEESKGSITYTDIARRVALTEDLVANYVKNLVEKGVPILKRYVNGKAHMKLNSHFKTLQAKENILQIEQKTITNLF